MLRIARYLASHREEALVASAAELAARLNTSDASVVRTAKALGFSGLDALRRSLAEELRVDLGPAGRVARTLEEVRGDAADVFEATLDLHLESLVALRKSVSSSQFQDAVDRIGRADRIAIFGIGPSSAMSRYFAIQIARFGLDSFAITDTGLLLADGLLRLRKRDLLVVMAYSRIYPELRALFDRADRLKLPVILITDTLAGKAGKHCDLVLQIPRGRTDRFSLHTATLGFLEALLVGIAAKRPRETIECLTQLNRLRTAVAGRSSIL